MPLVTGAWEHGNAGWYSQDQNLHRIFVVRTAPSRRLETVGAYLMSNVVEGIAIRLSNLLEATTSVIVFRDTGSNAMVGYPTTQTIQHSTIRLFLFEYASYVQSCFGNGNTRYWPSGNL